MLWQRVATATVGIPLALVVIWLGGWPLAVVMTLIAVLGLAELYRMGGVSDARIAITGCVVGAVVVAVLSRFECYGLVGLAGLATTALTGAPALLRHSELRRAGSRLRQVVIAEASWIYVPFLLGYVLRLRSLASGTVRHSPVPLGAALLFLAIGACWVTDAAAYLIGRKIGKHKLTPKISPGKTVEGAAAGLIGATLFVGALGAWIGLAPWSAALLGLTLGVVGQLGDLFESWLKRRAGVKDSGALLPGHGGILDRFDSLLFVAPLAYYWLSAAL